MLKGNVGAIIPAMDTDLTTIKSVLADISDTERRALIAATYGVPQTAPGPVRRPNCAPTVQNDAIGTNLHPISEGATPIPTARYPNGLEP
jgi:hypothetical protein